MSDLAVIVLNYGDPADTINLVDRLRQVPDVTTVVVVDNLSSAANRDGLARHLAMLGEEGIHFLPLPANGGYAAGNNAGLRHAFDVLGADFALVLNPDIDLLPGFRITLPREYASRVLIFTGVVSQHDREYSVLRFMPAMMRSVPQRDPSSDHAHYVSGCCFGITRAMWQTFGGFWEGYFLQFEELDFIYRYRQKFGRFPEVVVDRGIVVRHREGGSTGSAPLQSSPFNDYWSTRSRTLFYRRFLRSLLPIAIGYNLSKAMMCLLTRRGSNAVSVINGTRDGLFKV